MKSESMRAARFPRGLKMVVPALLSSFLSTSPAVAAVAGLAGALKADANASASAGAGAAAVWQPAVSASWQIVLQSGLSISASSPSVTPDVGIYDIDMFDHEGTDVIASLHSLGKKVICYFSAGSYEPDRPDSSQFTAADKGSELDGWPGEYWLNVSSQNVRDIMLARIQLASSMGCDAIDPDNVDGYENDNGLDLTEEQAVDFVQFLAGEASQLGMATGLKNAGDIIPDVLSVVQFSVNEQCNQYTECDTFAAFTAAGKPVFNIEYPSGAPGSVSATKLAKSCAGAGTYQLSTVVKDMDLDGWVEFCDGQTATTATD